MTCCGEVDVGTRFTGIFRANLAVLELNSGGAQFSLKLYTTLYQRPKALLSA